MQNKYPNNFFAKFTYELINDIVFALVACYDT